MTTTIPSLASALGSPPTEKLTLANYLYWKAQVVPAVRGAHAMGLLGGSDPAPAMTKEVTNAAGTTTTVPNPVYGAWISRDQQLVSYLIKTISPELSADVLDLEHAADI